MHILWISLFHFRNQLLVLATLVLLVVIITLNTCTFYKNARTDTESDIDATMRYGNYMYTVVAKSLETPIVFTRNTKVLC